MMMDPVVVTLPRSEWQEISRLLEVSIAELSAYTVSSKVRLPVTTKILQEQTLALGSIAIALEVSQ